MDYVNLSLDDKIAKCLINLRKLRPFYSAIYENIEKIESEKVDTIGVTSNKILYNKEFINSIGFEEFMFINLHEIAHIALMHVSRIGNRNIKIWNIACDFYVNKLLSKEFNIRPGETYNGLVKFCNDGLFCDSIDIDNDCVEDIYEKLFKQIGNKQDSMYSFSIGNNLYNINSNDSNNDIIDDGTDDNLKNENNSKVINNALIKCKMSSDSSNCILERYVDNLLVSKTDWKKLLRRYCIKSNESDISFSNPDRRMYYQKAIYPGQVKTDDNKISGIKICIDTSGSISNEELCKFHSDIESILKQFKLDAEVIYWDDKIESVGTFSNIKQFNKIKMIGFGGTDVNCVFKYFKSKECKVKPIVSIIFTDGYFYRDVSKKYNYKDTIWLMTDNYNKNFDKPFGKLAFAKYT